MVKRDICNDEIVNFVLSKGADYAKYFDTKDLIFSKKIRGYCEKNLCGNYGTNWACPPGVGEIEELEKDVKKFKNGVVYQFLVKIKGKDDRESMDRGKEEHNKLLRKIHKSLEEKYKGIEFFKMGAGECNICTRCAYLDNEKCRFPDKFISSAEAYGIDLMDLTEKCGLKFNYSKDTVAYIGLILW